MSSENVERSYVGYAENSIVREQADRPLIKMASVQVHLALDVGTGTGTGIQDLIEMNVLIEPYTAIGVDLDENNLEKAKKTLHLPLPPNSPNSISLQKGDAEHLPQIEDDSQELVLCRNMIHLTNASRVFAEMFRVLKPGGIVLVSSGYMRDKMYPPPEEIAKTRWGLILGLARRKLVKEHGYEKEKIAGPDLPDKYSSETLIRFAEKVNEFTNVQIAGLVIELDADAVAGLIKWERFAEGALPNIPIELAKQVMLEALEDPKLEGKTFPRGIFYLKAQKPY